MKHSDQEFVSRTFNLKKFFSSYIGQRQINLAYVFPLTYAKYCPLGLKSILRHILLSIDAIWAVLPKSGGPNEKLIPEELRPKFK